MDIARASFFSFKLDESLRAEHIDYEKSSETSKSESESCSRSGEDESES